jgi:hypothetical protein
LNQKWKTKRIEKAHGVMATLVENSQSRGGGGDMQVMLTGGVLAGAAMKGELLLSCKL